MAEHPSPPADSHADTRAVAGKVVLSWVGGLVGQASGSLTPDCAADWTVIVDLLFSHRLAALAEPALEASGWPVPTAVRASLDRFRAITSRMNAANMLTMRKILPRFDQAGVAVVAFKGPVSQHQIYANVFARPSSDLDLLVAPADYDRSGQILVAAGYRLADQCKSIWWRAGLGEQHYLGGGLADVTVDLHHRVQQPGCPMPRQPEAFLRARTPVSVGGQTVSALSPVHAHLVTAMSFVKALHHREPAARYAIDFSAFWLRQPPGHGDRLLIEAAGQGLRNTVALTIRAARLLFPSASHLPVTVEEVLADVSDSELLTMILYPDTPGLVWPKRRHLLLALYDRKRDYPAGLGMMVGSELLRQAGGLNPARTTAPEAA